jgi:hypothetical protein
MSKKSQRPAGKFAILTRKLKFILAYYLILMFLIVAIFIMICIGTFSLFETCLLLPVAFYAFLSCVYDLLAFKTELSIIEEGIVKKLLRLGRRYQKWKEEHW